MHGARCLSVCDPRRPVWRISRKGTTIVLFRSLARPIAASADVRFAALREASGSHVSRRERERLMSSCYNPGQTFSPIDRSCGPAPSCMFPSPRPESPVARIAGPRRRNNPESQSAGGYGRTTFSAKTEIARGCASRRIVQTEQIASRLGFGGGTSNSLAGHWRSRADLAELAIETTPPTPTHQCRKSGARAEGGRGQDRCDPRRGAMRPLGGVGPHASRNLMGWAGRCPRG